MPAYGKNLRPSEVAALVAFMHTLHPPGETPARDSTQPGHKAAQQTQRTSPPQTELARQ
jgi:ubiquinol-cytochrome c reductase cytochrome b subunit